MEQLESGSPAADPSGEAGDVVGAEEQTVDLAEELLGLPGAEPEVVRADHEHLVHELEASRSQMWHRSTADDE
ncbi:MAG: hypothetical protein ACO307_13775 [Ilumatobacteraceae bacterium]